MQIFVKTHLGDVLTLDVEDTNTIESVCMQIQSRQRCFPVDLQRLLYAGRELEHCQTLKSYNIEKESTLHLVQRMRGGMMHMTVS